MYLRSGLIEYENFVSLKRYGALLYSKDDIAIDLFLDNPILLYAHHDMFSNGIGSFNKTAKMINEIKPDIKWCSLGSIIRHLYLEKLREDGNYDVMAFSNDLIIENNHEHDAIFHIKKEESILPAIKQVSVDATPHSYHRSAGQVIINVEVPKGESRKVIIEYESDFKVHSIDLSKKNLKVRLLRYLSDFRDIAVYKIVLGRMLVKYYYASGLYKFGLKGVAFILVFLMIVIYGSLHLRKAYKR